MAKLMIKDGQNVGLEYPVGSKAIIGRHQSNEIPLSDHKASRQNSQIIVENGQYFLEDLNSRNGTILNGKKIAKEVLQHQDCIQIGETVLVFLQEEKVSFTKELRKEEPPVLRTLFVEENPSGLQEKQSDLQEKQPGLQEKQPGLQEKQSGLQEKQSDLQEKQPGLQENLISSQDSSAQKPIISEEKQSQVTVTFQQINRNSIPGVVSVLETLPLVVSSGKIQPMDSVLQKENLSPVTEKEVHSDSIEVPCLNELVLSGHETQSISIDPLPILPNLKKAYISTSKKGESKKKVEIKEIHIQKRTKKISSSENDGDIQQRNRKILLSSRKAPSKSSWNHNLSQYPVQIRYLLFVAILIFIVLVIWGSRWMTLSMLQ